MILEAQGLGYAFAGGVQALAALDLRVAKGHALALLGQNGAGKSTLLLHLNGSLRPSRGQVLLAGQPVAYSRQALNDWRRRVALVLQDPDDQLFAASVYEDISFGPLNLGLPEVETRARVEEALAALGISDLRDRPTHMLSGGQKRRVAIAGAVAMRPEVLLLDEPTAGLDAPSAAQLITLLKALQAGGMTLVFSTHDVDLAWQMADEVALFAQGRVVAQGPAQTLLTDPEALAPLGLEPPVLVAVAQSLQARGLLPAGALPRDRAELLAVLQA